TRIADRNDRSLFVAIGDLGPCVRHRELHYRLYHHLQHEEREQEFIQSPRALQLAPDVPQFLVTVEVHAPAHVAAAALVRQHPKGELSKTGPPKAYGDEADPRRQAIAIGNAEPTRVHHHEQIHDQQDHTADVAHRIAACTDPIVIAA